MFPNFYQNQKELLTAALDQAKATQAQIEAAAKADTMFLVSVSPEYDEAVAKARELVDYLGGLLSALEPMVDAERISSPWLD